MKDINNILRMSGSNDNVFRVLITRDFFNHVLNQKTENESERLIEFQQAIRKIKNNDIRRKGLEISDFYVPIYHPSFDKDGSLVFEANTEPKINVTVKFWEETLKEYETEYSKFEIGSSIYYQIYRVGAINYLKHNGFNTIDAMNAVLIDTETINNDLMKNIGICNLKSGVLLHDKKTLYFQGSEIYSQEKKYCTFLKESVPFILFRRTR